MREIHVVTPKGIRNRCGDINCSYRDGKISAQQAERLAQQLADGWSVHEPDTEFKIRWTGEEEARPSLAEELLDNIAQELGLLVSARRYLEECNKSDVQLLNSWMAGLTDIQRDILLNGGDEEIYALAPKGVLNRPVSYIIEEFTV